MRTTQSLSITLPLEMADMIKAKVRSGEYASESEVIRDGLRALTARDAAMERWLREEVLPVYDDVARSLDKAVPADQAWDKVDAHINRKTRRRV